MWTAEEILAFLTVISLERTNIFLRSLNILMMNLHLQNTASVNKISATQRSMMMLSMNLMILLLHHHLHHLLLKLLIEGSSLDSILYLYFTNSQ
jgi:hypothetical protein